MSKNLTRTPTFNRVLSFFLAVILTVGLVAQVLPAAKAFDTSKVPDTLTLDHVGYGLDGKLATSDAEGATYTSPVLGGTVYVQDFQMKDEGTGQKVTAFCYDHSKLLGNQSTRVTWGLDESTYINAGNDSTFIWC